MGFELLQPSLQNDPRSRAFANTLDRLRELQIDKVLVYRIATVIPDALPFLAEQFSVTGLEGWFWAQDDAERRHLIQNAIPLHKLKGTLEGYKTILRMTKRAGLHSYIAPPDIPYPSRDLTEQEWAEFLAQQPQVRLYRYDVFGQANHAAFLRKCFLVEGEADPEHKTYPAVTDAVRRIRERPFLVEPDGTTTELRVWNRKRIAEDKFATTVDTVIKPGKAIGVFLVTHGDWEDPEKARFIGLRNEWGNGFLVNHTPIDRMYRLELIRPYTETSDQFRRRLLSPGYEPLRVQYELIHQRSTARGQHLSSVYLAPSTVVSPPPPPPLEPPKTAWRLHWNVAGSILEV